MNIRTFLAAAALSLGAAVAAPAGAYDERLQTCHLCHGANGQGNHAINAPRIAGLSEDYLGRQLMAFKLGWRGRHPEDIQGQEMWPNAAILDAETIQVAAQTFAAMAARAAPMTLEGGMATAGAKLYATCAACHGSNGEGNDALGAPALKGQADWYLATQLNNYRAGWRGSHPADSYGAQMRASAAVLQTEQDVLNVVAYIGTLSR